MSNSLNPVFGQWYTDKQLGNGTDGKVFSIYKENYDGSRDTSVLKIIRLGENRNERKIITALNDISAEDDDYYEKVIKNITDNIETIRKSDAGKSFVKYEDVELRNASDGKGKLILIKLENCKSLADLLKEFSFTLDETLRLGINICKALVKCRSFGYIYPNLKPENILFDADGRCKLGDFGTFSLLEPAKYSVAFKRTEYFMAPEYIRSGNINCTADTYSLGLVLYMLTNRGRLPFSEPYPQKETVSGLNSSVEKRLAGEMPEKPVFASEELWSIICKACNPNPNNRYFTPDQMLSDLKNALDNKPFEQPVYDEVYSESVNGTEEEVLLPVTDEKADYTNAEEITPALSIKEEIQIPEIVPVYKKKNTAKKKIIKYEKLPEIKRPVKKENKEPVKKLIILAVIAVLLVLLFIISAVLHSGSSENQAVSAVICNAADLFYTIGGVTLNGCPNG